MNIIFSQHNDIRIQGLAQAIASVNPTTFIWDSNQKPLFDVLQEVKADVIFYHDMMIADNTIKFAQEEFPDTQFVFLKFNSLLPTNGTPDLTVVMEQKLVGGNLFLDYFTNLVDLRKREYIDKFNSIVTVFTDSIDTNDSFISLCLRTLCHNFPTKIYGSNIFHFPNYLGALEPLDYGHVLNSSKIYVGFNLERFRDALFCNCHPFILNGPTDYSFSNLDDLLVQCRQRAAVPPKANFCFDDRALDTYHGIVTKIFTKLDRAKIAEAAKVYETGAIT